MKYYIVSGADLILDLLAILMENLTRLRLGLTCVRFGEASRFDDGWATWQRFLSAK